VSTAKTDIKVVQFGLGPIGLETLRRALKWEGITVTGCVEARREQGEWAVAGLSKELGVDPPPVSADIDSLIRENGRADVALHTAVSSLSMAVPQIEQLVGAGLNVVTTAEEMICPVPAGKPWADRLHKAARQAGVTVFPSGVNPGFLMDRLVLFLTSLSHKIDHVEVERFVDCSTRRKRLQEKLGVGTDPKEIEKKIKGGKAGHVGLEESLRFVAAGLRLPLDSVEVRIEPVVVDNPVRRNGVSLEPGQVAGIYHEAVGKRAGKALITMKLRMAADREGAFDRIRISGIPPVDVRFEGGVAGDEATVACILNSVPYVLSLSPGLATCPPSPHYWDNWNGLS